MRALVVFESMFGNSEKIARAVADGLATRMRADLVEVGAAPAVIEDDVRLLVVGAPTHVLSLSRPNTRRSAAEQAPQGVVSRGPGVREWLESLRGAPDDVVAAAFDTRIDKPLVPKSAARSAARRLRNRGFRLAAPATSFHVTDTTGPLVAGELDRARAWGVQLAASVLQPGGFVRR